MTSTHIFVINGDNDKIYEMQLSHTQYKGKNSYSVYHLYLVAGVDYVNPDWSDQQGWVNNERFIEDVQLETFVHYFVVESLEDALAEEGYEIIDDLPKIW